jgi:hypothetical protein
MQDKENAMYGSYSDTVREIARQEYVQPMKSGEIVRIRLGDLQAKARERGVPRQDTNLIATAIESEKKFWKPLGLEMLTPKGQSRRVDSIFEYRVVGNAQETGGNGPAYDPLMDLVGMLKGAFPEGAEAFLRDLRRDKEPGL